MPRTRAARAPQLPDRVPRSATPTGSAPPSCGGSGSARSRPALRRLRSTLIADRRRTRTSRERRHRRHRRCPTHERPGRIARRPRRDAVRRGRGRVGQDDRARRSGRRARRAPATAELASIAAITFTEKAGAELRDRIRRELEERAASTGRAGRSPRRCAARRIDQLDGAAIGTLHAFAQRILWRTRSRPASRRASRCSTRSAPTSSSSGAGALPRRAARRPGARADAPPAPRRRGEARRRSTCSPLTFEQNWDLVEDRCPTIAPEPPRVAHLLAPALARASTPCASARPTARTTTTAVRAARRDRRRTSSALRALDDELELLEALVEEVGRERSRASRPATAARRPTGPTSRRRCATVRAAGEALDAAVRTRSAQAVRAAHRCGAPRASRCEAADERRAAGPARVPRPARARPLAAPRPGARRGVRAAPPRALPAAAARRVPGHRPDPDRARRPHRGRRSRRRRGRARPVGRGRRRARPALRGRRPEAVDLPVPARRHRACSSRPGTASAEAGGVVAAHRQLPYRRPDHRLGQRRLRRADGRRRRRRLRSPSQPPTSALDAGARRRRRSARRCRSSVATSPTRGARRRAAGGRGRRGGRRRSPASSTRAGRSTTDDGRLAPGRARRHHDPRARPARRCRSSRTRSTTPASRTGPSRARSCTHAGRPRPARWCCAPSTTPPTTCASSPRCARRCSPAATTTCSASRSSAAATGATSADQPDTVPADDPVRPGSRTCARCTTSASGSAPVGAARPHRPRPPGLRARLRRGPAARRVAPAALRHRPGPGVERVDRREPPPVPPLGRAADRTRAPGSPRRCCPRPTTTRCGS